MKNAIRVLSMIAFTGSALMAAANPSFAAPRPHAVAHRTTVMKHKKGGKKVLINLQRKARKGRKTSKKARASEPVINQA